MKILPFTRQLFGSRCFWEVLGGAQQGSAGHFGPQERDTMTTQSDSRSINALQINGRARESTHPTEEGGEPGELLKVSTGGLYCTVLLYCIVSSWTEFTLAIIAPFSLFPS